MLVRERSNFWKYFSDVVFICLGASLEAFSIKFLLVPNDVIDGGLVGIALIFSHLASGRFFSLFLIIITIPFLTIAMRTLGGKFLIKMALAFSSLIISNQIFEMFPGDLLSKNLGDIELIVSGAVVLGVGVGLTLKYGGCVDGTEIVAVLLQKSKGISIGTTILFFNFFIYSFAAIAYNQLTTGVKSIITYMIASFVMDFVNSGARDVKMMYIFTNYPENISESISNDLKIGSTVIESNSARSGRKVYIVLVAVNKIRLNSVKEIIEKEDRNAFFVVSDVSETCNGLVDPIGKTKEVNSVF